MRKLFHLSGVVLIVGLMVLVFALKLPPVKGKAQYIVWIWFISFLFFLLLTAILSHWISSAGWFGFLIDERQRYSLSQIQIVCWTLIFGASVFTAALWNRMNDQPFTDLTIPQEMFILLGISGLTLAASKLALVPKKNEKINVSELNRNVSLLKRAGINARTITFTPSPGEAIKFNPEPLKTDEVGVGAEGQVVHLDRPSLALLLNGDENGNVGTIDIGKLQMLYVTGLVLLIYCTAIVSSFHQAALNAATQFHIVGMPPFSESLVGLIAVSHAGYIVNKAVSHTAAATSDTLPPPEQPAESSE